jgi:hypothetical protein
VIKPGEEWGTPTDDEADLVVRGDDTALAAVLPDDAGRVPLVRFVPEGSDLARAVGLAAGVDARPRGLALPIDAVTTAHGPAVNVVVVGPAPAALRPWHRSPPVRVTVDGRTVHDGPATTVVVANGQFDGPADLAPRGHPGDGRLEIQVYALRPGERAAMRRRLPTGTHVPHPRIVTTTGRAVTVHVGAAGLAARLDGRPIGRVRSLDAAVRHPALRLLL